MFTKEKKEESKAKSGRPRNRLLRLFGSNDIFSGSLVTLGADREDAYGVNPKTIEGAMLDAEYQKARAVLEFQRNERFH